MRVVRDKLKNTIINGLECGLTDLPGSCLLFRASLRVVRNRCRPFKRKEGLNKNWLRHSHYVDNDRIKLRTTGIMQFHYIIYDAPYKVMNLFFEQKIILLRQIYYCPEGTYKGPPAITRRALEIAENYCPRTKIVIKIFFQSFTKSKLPFCRICHEAFFILIQFLCNLNSFLDKN